MTVDHEGETLAAAIPGSQTQEQGLLQDESSSTDYGENGTGEGMPSIDRHMRFPTQDLEDTHTIEKTGTYDKSEISEEDCYDKLEYSYPSWKKW